MEPYPSYMAAHMAPKITNLATSHPPSHGLYKPPHSPCLNPSNPLLMKFCPSSSPLGRNPLQPSWCSWRPNGGRKASFNPSHGRLKTRSHHPPLKVFHRASSRLEERIKRRRREVTILAWKIRGFAGWKEVFKRRRIPDLGVQSKKRRRVLLGL